MFSGRIYNRSNNSYSLFSLLANSRNNMLSQAHIVKGRDTVSISNTAKEMAARKVSTGRHHNTNIDKSIDLQKYIDLAAKNNQSALENAGNSINVKTKNYSGTGVAFRCQTAHCGRRKPHVDFGTSASPTAQSRG